MVSAQEIVDYFLDRIHIFPRSLTVELPGFPLPQFCHELRHTICGATSVVHKTKDLVQLHATIN
jgi:hypothetical protein